MLGRGISDEERFMPATKAVCPLLQVNPGSFGKPHLLEDSGERIVGVYRVALQLLAVSIHGCEMHILQALHDGRLFYCPGKRPFQLILDLDGQSLGTRHIQQGRHGMS